MNSETRTPLIATGVSLAIVAASINWGTWYKHRELTDTIPPTAAQVDENVFEQVASRNRDGNVVIKYLPQIPHCGDRSDEAQSNIATVVGQAQRWVLDRNLLCQPFSLASAVDSDRYSCLHSGNVPDDHRKGIYFVCARPEQ